MRIRIIVSSSRSEIMISTLSASRKDAAGGRAEIEMVGLEKAGPPAGMECWYEEYLAGPYIVKEAKRAELEGCSAVIVDCMLDPCIAAARQAVGIPVIGPGQSSINFTQNMCSRFSILTVWNSINTLRSHIPLEIANRRVLDVVGVHAPLTRLVKPDEELLSEMQRISEEQVERGAEAILLGCTGMSLCAKPLSERLQVPLVEPISIAVHTAITMCELGLSHSKAAYPYPPPR